MILSPTTKKALMVVAVVWGGLPSALAGSMQGDAATADCNAILDGLRQVETETLQAIASIRTSLLEAEHLSEWYGGETVDAYIAVLRDRERLLRKTLEEIRTVNCTGVSKLTCCKPG